MSKKSTKIIAVAGVVAGLGVAALPALTFATTNRSVDGAVKIEAEVLPSLAMTIVSNGDQSGTLYYNDDPSGSAAGYSITGTRYTKSADLFTNWSSAKTSLLPNATDETMTSTVTVYTNAATYSLSVADEDTNNNLVSENSDTIAPIVADADLTAGTAGGQWGLKWGSATKYSPVPVSTGSALSIVNGGTADPTGDATNITYGVATSATQAIGTYTDVIVYTATASN